MDDGSDQDQPERGVVTPTEHADGGDWPRITVACKDKPQVDGTYEVLYAGRRRVNGKPVWAMGTRRVYNFVGEEGGEGESGGAGGGGGSGHWAIAVGVDSPFTGRRIAMSAESHGNTLLPHEMGSWVVWDAGEERWTGEHGGLCVDEAEELFTPSPVAAHHGHHHHQQQQQQKNKKKKKKEDGAVTEVTARSLGLELSADLVVTRVMAEKPAAKAGLAVGDRLVWVKNVNTQRIVVLEFREALFGAAAGNRFVDVGFLRGNVKGSVTLDTPPDPEKVEEERRRQSESTTRDSASPPPLPLWGDNDTFTTGNGERERTPSATPSPLSPPVRTPMRGGPPPAPSPPPTLPSPGPTSSVAPSPSPRRQERGGDDETGVTGFPTEGGTLLKVRSWTDISNSLPVSNAATQKVRRRKLFRQLDAADEKRVHLADVTGGNRLLDLLGGVHHAPLWSVEGAYRVVAPKAGASLDLRKFRVFLEVLRRQFLVFAVYGTARTTKIGYAECSRLVPLLVEWRSGVVEPGRALSEAGGSTVVDLVQLSNWAVRQGLETAFSDDGEEGEGGSPRVGRSGNTNSSMVNNGSTAGGAKPKKRGGSNNSCVSGNGTGTPQKRGSGRDGFGRSHSSRSTRSAQSRQSTSRRSCRGSVSVSPGPRARRAVTPSPMYRHMNPAVTVSPQYRDGGRGRGVGGGGGDADASREWERYVECVPTGDSVVARVERRRLFNKLDVGGQGVLPPHDVIQGLLDVLDFGCSVLTPTAATAIAASHRLVVTHMGTPLGSSVGRKAFRLLLEALRMHFQLYQALGAEAAPLDIPEVKLVEPLLRSWGLKTTPDPVATLKEASGGLERVPLPTFCSWAVGKALRQQ